MSFLNACFNSSDCYQYLLTVLIITIVYKLFQFYNRVYSLPPGPFPLPILGNFLLFRSEKHWNQLLIDVGRDYGPVFTLWLGTEPYIIVKDLEVAKQTFSKDEFSGRPSTFLGNIVSNERYSDIAMCNNLELWRPLRNICLLAVRKYAKTDKLAQNVSKCVEQTMEYIIEREGFDKPFCPSEYITHLIVKTISAAAFGKVFDINDPEYQEVKHIVKELRPNPRFVLWDFSPIIRLIDRKAVNHVLEAGAQIIASMREKFVSHYKDYDESVVRDFCDFLIGAKNAAIVNDRRCAPHIKDENISLAILDIFIAGFETSSDTFDWMLLFLVYYPQIQQKLRQEIDTQVGDRMATHEDRARCHYAMAFIAEVLRCRNVLPVGVYHMTQDQVQIDNYTLPKGTGLFLHQGAIMMDEKYWSAPELFNPERFLTDGVYDTKSHPAFIPFGSGRRRCLGEKLAYANLFVILATFVQKTRDYEIVLHSDRGVGPNPSKAGVVQTSEYKVILKRKTS